MAPPQVSFSDAGADGLSGWEWWCEAGKAEVGETSVGSDGKSLSVVTKSGQDWWKKPGHYACNAPAFVRSFDASSKDKDFTASVTITGEWKQTFDQGCIFLHVTPKDGSAARWVKAGIEREDDLDWIGAVVTTQYADWAIASPPASHAQLSSTPIRFTLSRVSHKLLVRAEDSSNPLLFRKDVNGFFDGIEAGEVRIGVMACQPGEERKGVKCRFEEFEFAFAS